MAFNTTNPVEPHGARDNSAFTWRARLVKALMQWAGRVVRRGGKELKRASSEFQITSNLGDLDRLNAAIFEGTVRIAFAGDSIVEGDRDGLYDNSVVATVMRALREQNPGIHFVAGNFSLSGRGIGALATETYVGQPYPEDLATGFYRPDGSPMTDQWPGGSVVGKSWMGHLRDFAPDFVMVMHGANDLSGSSLGNTTALKHVLSLIRHFPKVPSVGLATTALPAVSAGYQEEAQIAADGVRAVARELNLTLVDINRAFNRLRAGIDVANLVYTRDDTFVGYPAGWDVEAHSTLSLADAGGGLIRGSGSALRNTQSLDVNIKATFSCPSWFSTTCALHYRSMGAPEHQYSAQISSGSLVLYWGATRLGFKAIGALASGSKVVLQVDVQGALHRVYVNHVLQLTVHDYHHLRRGNHGVAIMGGAGTIADFIVHTGDYSAVEVPQLSDLELYGGDHLATHNGVADGNGINHPTRQANSVCWAAAFSALVDHIRVQKRAGR